MAVTEPKAQVEASLHTSVVLYPRQIPRHGRTIRIAQMREPLHEPRKAMRNDGRVDGFFPHPKSDRQKAFVTLYPLLSDRLEKADMKIFHVVE